MAVSIEPDRTEKDEQQHRATRHAQRAKQPLESAGMDFRARGVKIDVFAALIGRRCDVVYWNPVAH
ncbi:hypothetical protein A245_26138 [Pseudomonas syringae pv. actinidiae ICMP 19096]|uniref:Uncharacterized protein n=1 Tax=Pseudomonas syringae pv. actinidiae ICMP 19096 TaxID=1194405 RepID=A0A656JTC8_PSESF|nr:hypothetical protein A245_26138 [Pseudomonas syringae pv. actinidiae ICMP 19096]